MTAALLKATLVEKPWGRFDIPPAYTASCDRRVGEIIFTEPEEFGEPELIVKRIFTSQMLSVQVHPDDEKARAIGMSQGKTECWYVTAAEEGAELFLGFNRNVSAEEVRSAALDGSILSLMERYPARKGDFFWVPGGTVHAIGAGISLIEVQQVSDVTYRLFDFGRPRALHVEEAIAVMQRSGYDEANISPASNVHFETLSRPGPFHCWRAAGDAISETMLYNTGGYLIPLSGQVRIGNLVAAAGDCARIAGSTQLEVSQDFSAIVAARRV